MEVLKLLLVLARENMGAFAVLAILLLIRYQDQREVRQSQDAQRDDNKEQALIDVLGKFVGTLDAMSKDHAEALEKLKTALERVTGILRDHDVHASSVVELVETTRRELADERAQRERDLDALPEQFKTAVTPLFDSVTGGLNALAGVVKDGLDKLPESQKAILSLELDQYTKQIERRLDGVVELIRLVQAEQQRLAISPPSSVVLLSNETSQEESRESANLGSVGSAGGAGDRAGGDQAAQTGMD